MTTTPNTSRPLSPLIVRLRNLAFPMVAVAVLVAFSIVKLWLVGAIFVFALYLLIQIRKHKAMRQPENSLELRRLAFAAQAVSIITLAYTTQQIWHIAILSLVILAIGHYVAYRVRSKPPIALRLGTAVCLHLAFGWMFYALFHGQPFPQAQIAMLAMAIVSFELFSRLNLFSGLGIAMLNLYVAATLSRDLMFGALLLAFIGLLLAFLWRADSEDGVKDNPVILRPVQSTQRISAFQHWRNWGLRFGLSLAVFVPIVFLITPHYAGHPIVPPVSFQVPITKGASSGIINPAVPLVQLQGQIDPNQTGEYYTGFDSTLDLSYRGGLSDTIMMYVRSPAWSYWRSHAYDYYDGHTWTQSDQSTDVITGQGQFFQLATDSWLRKDYFVQTYYIARTLPNLIFTAGKPLHLYLAAREVAIDKTGGIHIGEALRENTVYSVLSLRTTFPADDLRAVEDKISDDAQQRAADLAPYLQLSATVTERTRKLAHDLTQNATTRYDKITVLRDYLRANYPYDYFPPPQQPNTDTADQFLFVDKRGLCEHYVTSLVVMLRELGIPARLVAGFGSGTYNAVTGYYEVRANNAHAWAEVYFPQYGWVPFDPTPGWNGNPDSGPVQRWVFSSLFEDVKLPSLPMGEIFRAGTAALSAIATPLIVLVILVLLGFAAWRLRKFNQHYKLGQRLEVYLRRDPARRRIFGAYYRAQRQLKSYRTSAQTVHEHAATQPELTELAQLVEIAAYKPEVPDATMVSRALAWRKQRK
ncbi:MAG: transglutaminaseTgpA domain-containing protein [Chloroflexota bacterium]